MIIKKEEEQKILDIIYEWYFRKNILSDEIRYNYFSPKANKLKDELNKALIQALRDL